MPEGVLPAFVRAIDPASATVFNPHLAKFIELFSIDGLSENHTASVAKFVAAGSLKNEGSSVRDPAVLKMSEALRTDLDNDR